MKGKEEMYVSVRIDSLKWNLGLDKSTPRYLATIETRREKLREKQELRLKAMRQVVVGRGKRRRNREIVSKAEKEGPRFKLPDLRMEWIQGPKPGSLVQEGHHIMIGQVSYKDHLLQTCRMKLNVLVRKCPPLMLPKHMTVQCSLGNSWGSKCQFSCNNGLHVVGQSSSECMDDLSWSHHIPVCEASKGCPAPMSPPHGQLLCQAHLEETRSQVLPENAKCEYVCDAGYEIPATQYHLTTILCQDGAWNSTVDPTCINIGGIALDHPNAIQREAGHKRRRHKLRSGLHKRSHGDPCNPNPCKEGGTCLRGPKSAPAICRCPDHREGDFCEYERCREKCENGGKCVIFDEKAVCYCPPGFHGNLCEVTDSR
ncbi:Cadherin-related tumor suppressor [Gryllus bimaculatus]|nr:Cadherin-related tumor suppressor [Gryllus bimaculatus]